MKKTYELNTGLIDNVFTGTYEGIWEVDEYDEDGVEQLEVSYNFSDLIKSIADEYAAHDLTSMINEKLPTDFIKSITVVGTYSPKFYNYETDMLDLSVEVDGDKLEKLLDNLVESADIAKLREFLHDNYTSRDGFNSYTPNNIFDIRESIVNDFDNAEQALGALISFYTQNESDNYYDTIEGQVHEGWRGNGYGGLNYTVIE